MVQKRSRTAVRQKQIIDAAGRLIIKFGSEHVTVRRIAHEIGISESAIYKHFKSKKDILSLLIEDIEDNLLSLDELNPAVGLGTLETLENTFTRHLEHIVARKGISFQIIAEIVSLGDKKLNKKVYEVIQKYKTRLAAILEQGIKAGLVRPEIDRDAMSTLFFCLAQGLVNIWTLSHYSFDLKQKYASLWSVFREAIIKHQS